MHEAGVRLKRTQEILGYASERSRLAIYRHSMRRSHDDSADKVAVFCRPYRIGNVSGSLHINLIQVAPTSGSTTIRSEVQECFLRASLKLT